MEFERTRDVLDHVRAFHERVSSFYENLADEANQQRTRMILDYMSRHEKHLQESIGRYEEDAAKEILDTWFQYSPEEDLLVRLTDIEVTHDMSVDDVVGIAMRLDDSLIELYGELEESALSENVKDLFSNLLELEKQEEHKIARTGLEAKTL